MNPKVANVIAAELGILIGLMSLLVYSQFRSPEQRTAAEMRRSRVAPVTTVTPEFESRNQRPYPVDYGPDRERGEQPPQWAQVYYQSIAPPRYARSAVENGSIAAYWPSYPETYKEPAAVPADYATSPQTIVYVEPTQFVAYTEPIQTVVFSNSRRLGHRGRSIPRACPPRVITPRLNTLSAGPSGNVLSAGPSGNVLSLGPSGNVLSRATAIAPSGRPAEGFRPRRNR